MRTYRPATIATILGIALMCVTPAEHAASARPAHAKHGWARGRAPHGWHLRGARGLPRFRPARRAAGQDAARLGALVGHDCTGKADMPRNDHEWVVMCSNGKTFVVQAPAQAGAPPIECSLAGTGPMPACFTE